jgi:hypothetical protein
MEPVRLGGDDPNEFVDVSQFWENAQPAVCRTPVSHCFALVAVANVNSLDSRREYLNRVWPNNPDFGPYFKDFFQKEHRF